MILQRNIPIYVTILFVYNFLYRCLEHHGETIKKTPFPIDLQVAHLLSPHRWPAAALRWDRHQQLQRGGEAGEVRDAGGFWIWDPKMVDTGRKWGHILSWECLKKANIVGLSKTAGPQGAAWACLEIGILRPPIHGHVSSKDDKKTWVWGQPLILGVFTVASLQLPPGRVHACIKYCHQLCEECRRILSRLRWLDRCQVEAIPFAFSGSAI